MGEVIMRVIKYFPNFNKEEKWLNEMYQKGFSLKYVCLYSYYFDKHESNNKDSIIKIDYRKFKTQDEFQNYCSLFEDSGWKHIVGNKNTGVQYFIRIDKHASNDIFSDDISNIDRYKRKAEKWFSGFVILMPTLIMFWMTGLLNISRVLNIKDYYYTPGLWDMKGIRFWIAFLFETPFAFGRTLIAPLYVLVIAIYVLIGIRAFVLYKLKLNKLMKSI